MKICVYAISKNEEQFVDRFVEAAQDADMILVADTGSTDGMVDKLKAWNRPSSSHPLGIRAEVVVRDISIKPWRFDHARNAALASIPADIDICVSLDLDEVLQPGWRDEIERVWKAGETTRLRYMFDWGCGIAFWYEKIHARHGYFWHHPCHEYPMPDGRITEVWADASPDFLMVIHKPDNTKSRGQYLDLLKLSVTEDPHCPRNAFYYARELSFVGQWEESIKECDRFLALPRATWHTERCYAHRVKGRCYQEMGDWHNAEVQFMLAAADAPETREPWCELAKVMYFNKRWHECFAYAMKTLSITDRHKVYTVDPEVWSHWPHTWASIAAWQLGLKDVSKEQAALAFAHAPEDAMVKGNHEFFGKQSDAG
jgi:hypothetical protein